MKKLAIISALALLFAPTVPTYAADFNIVGTIPMVVKEHNNAHLKALATPRRNIVLLQKVELSPKAQQAFANRINKLKKPTFKILNAYSSEENKALNLPSHINLGMNNVPVLNQGAHGSCVTFAVAGSIDSLLGKGDYISELCSLTLGNALAEKNSNYPSGWNGSYGSLVLEQFFEYGIVPMDKQKTVGCGGLTSYPVWDPTDEGMSTSPDEYRLMSEPLNQQYEWHPIFSNSVAFIDSLYNPQKMLDDVKKSLNKGNRLTFGVLLDISQGSNGAVGTHNIKHDTWMLTPEIEDNVKNGRVDAGHEMIIIGYDDNVVVKDGNGNTNKGILILRNSWSQFAGDHGNYYMTYDHFKLMTDEIQVVTEKSSN